MNDDSPSATDETPSNRLDQVVLHLALERHGKVGRSRGKSLFGQRRLYLW